MLAFVTTLRHPATAFSWDRICELLARTLASVCRQTCEEFRVIVVCNEKPQINFRHPSVEFVEVDLPPPVNSPAALIANMRAVYADKALKHYAALQHLSLDPPDQIMFFDADDLISNQLAAFAKHAPPVDLYYGNYGYAHSYGSRFIFAYRRNFYQFCGSCHVISWSAFGLPEGNLAARSDELLEILCDHNILQRRFAAAGKKLAPLPFAPAIYMIGTGENHSAVGSLTQIIRKAKDGLLAQVAAVKQIRPITPAMREEFFIPVSPQIGRRGVVPSDRLPRSLDLAPPL